MRTGLPAAALLWATLAGVAAAETPPVAVSAQSDECFHQNGTIPLSCDIECVSSQPCEDLHVNVCSNAQILGATPGSANQPPGGTFEQTTCSQPSQPFGASFTVTGTIPPSTHDTVFFACAPSSLTGSTASFLVAASDKTGQTATTTVTVPVCVSPYSISVNPSQTCFNPGGPFTIDVSGTNTTAGALTDFKVSECSQATVTGETPGSTNQPPGGSFTHSTCTLGIGGTWAASGSWPAGKQNDVTFSFVAPTNAGATSLPFQFSISDATDTPVSKTFSMPTCTASGPLLQVTKYLQNNLVNGHVRQNDEVEFIIKVTNIGSAPTSGTITVTDSQPSESGIIMKGGSVPAEDSPCSVALNTVDCQYPVALKPEDTQYFFVFCTVTKTGDFENVATVTGDGAAPASGTVSFGVFPPRPQVVRQGVPPRRDVRGNPIGNP